MPLSVDMRKIVKAEVVAWEIEKGLSASHIPTLKAGKTPSPFKAEAEKIVKDIAAQKVFGFNDALDRV